MADDRIIVKRSGIPGDIPLASQLELGELALNYADGRLFARLADNTVSDLAGLPASNNTIYVSVEGDDTNSGKEPGEPKRTIRAALNAIGPGNTVVVAAGTYIEQTPLIMPQGTTVHGVDQRITTIRPNVATKDIFWVSSGCYIAGLAFRGHMKPSYAVAFPGNVEIGVAQSAGPGSNTIVLSSANAVTGTGMENYYREMRITITGGAGVGQSRNVVTYNVATKTANVDANWTTAIDDTSSYLIDIAIPAAPSLNTRYSTHIIASPYLYNMASVTSDQLLSVSTTSQTIDDGLTRPLTKNFTIATGLTNVEVGRWVRIVYDAQNYFTGTITSYTSATGVLQVNIAKSVRSSQVARGSWTVYYICGSGMEIDGYRAAGLRSMVSAQFTQFNSGGDAIVMKNMGYAQLVSIYAICCEDAFLAESGGTASMGNCNVNFGTYGLIALDVGPLLMSGRSGFIYDELRCQRDTKLIIQGIAQDLLSEGVSQSAFSGIQYWNQDSVVANSSNTLTVSTGSKTFNVESGLTSTVVVNDYVRLIHDELNYMYGQITAYDSVTGGITVSVTGTGGAGSNTGWQIYGPGNNRIPSTQLTATLEAIQNVSESLYTTAQAAVDAIPNADTKVETFVRDAALKIKDITANGTSNLTNEIVKNSLSISVNAVVLAVNTAIVTNKGNTFASGTIVNTAINKVKTAYPSLVFDVDKCGRDLGYIIDCINYDLIYNSDETFVAPSNRQTIQAGVAYFEYTTQSALNDESPQTVAAFDFLKTNVANILVSDAANNYIREAVNTRIDIITDLITNGPTGQATFTGTISGTTLTVSAVSANTIRKGMSFKNGANGGIVRQLTGTTGGAGTYEISNSQTVASNTTFNVDYVHPISLATRNTAASLATAMSVITTNDAVLAGNVTNDYIDTIYAPNGYDNQTGYFVNVSNILAVTDPRFAITTNTKPYLGLVMYIEGEKTVDIQPGPGYAINETIRISARDNLSIPLNSVTRTANGAVTSCTDIVLATSSPADVTGWEVTGTGISSSRHIVSGAGSSTIVLNGTVTVADGTTLTISPPTLTGTVSTFDLSTGAANVSITAKTGNSIYRYWYTERTAVAAAENTITRSLSSGSGTTIILTSAAPSTIRGWRVSGTGIADDTVVTGGEGTTTVTLSKSVSTPSGTITFTPPKVGRFTQEIDVSATPLSTLSIVSIDTSKEINKYRTVVAANTIGDITYLELDERIPDNIVLDNTLYTSGIPKNKKVYFYQKSALSASGQTFEFVGSGTSTAVALPRNGGDIVQANEVVSSNGGVVYFTSTDQFGNFRIGEDLTINFNTGTLSGRTFTRSLFAQITPFVLALDS